MVNKGYLAPNICIHPLSNTFLLLVFIPKASKNMLFPFINIIYLVTGIYDFCMATVQFFYHPPLFCGDWRGSCIFNIILLSHAPWSIRDIISWNGGVGFCEFLNKDKYHVQTKHLFQIPLQLGPHRGLYGYYFQTQQKSTDRGTSIGVVIDLGYPWKKMRGGGGTVLIMINLRTTNFRILIYLPWYLLLVPLPWAACPNYQ